MGGDQSQSWPEVLRGAGTWCWPGVREAPGRVDPFPCNSNVGKPSITASPFGSWRRLPAASNPRACGRRRRWSSRSERGLERGVREHWLPRPPLASSASDNPGHCGSLYKHKQARTRPRRTSGLWNLQVLLAELGPSCFSKRKVGDSWAMRPGGSLVLALGTPPLPQPSSPWERGLHPVSTCQRSPLLPAHGPRQAAPLTIAETLPGKCQ